MWKLSFIFLLGSVLVTGWMSYELGLLGYTPGIAGEPVSASEGTASRQSSAKPTTGLQSLQDSLPAREKAVAEREAELTKKARELADKEQLLSSQTARYETIIRELQKKNAALEALNDSKIEAFKKLYEKMEPKKVASILEEMEPPMAAQILGEMRPQQAAEIMGKMPNAKVRLLTEKYLVKRMTASAKTPGQ